MKLPEPRDEDDEDVLHHIHESGVFIQSVFGDENSPNFGYSMGLTHNFDHPEVFISGLPSSFHKLMINAIASRLKNRGAPLRSGERVSGLLSGFDCIAAHVEPSAAYEYVYYAQWLHGTKDVPLMQLIWPSTSGVWPWDANAPTELLESQIILADVNSELN